MASSKRAGVGHLITCPKLPSGLTVASREFVPPKSKDMSTTIIVYQIGLY